MMIGSRVKKARDKISLSRQKLTDILNSREDRPTLRGERDSLSPETLKKWEYGENPINIEWLPVICDVLDCDIGYLFGEYKEQRRETADVCKVTGLTETAVDILQNLSASEFGAVYFSLDGSVSSCEVVQLLSMLIESEQFTEMFKELGYYLMDTQPGNSTPTMIPVNDLINIRKTVEQRGYKIVKNEDVAEMHLQTAADMFKNAFKDILKNQKGVKHNGTKK